MSRDVIPGGVSTGCAKQVNVVHQIIKYSGSLTFEKSPWLLPEAILKEQKLA